jgi:hypothetical protein
MKIVLLITVIESLAIAAWLTLRLFKTASANMPTAATITPVPKSAYANSTMSSSLEDLRWNFINGWKVADQADDRRLTTGTVAERAGSAPALRSFARRSHQRSFKAWSQERHD